MTPAQLARADQLAAAERDFERRTVRAARQLVALFVLAGLYAFLAVAGVLPALPWTAIA